MIGYCLTPSYTLEMPKQCICLGVAEYGSGACVAHLLLSSFITPIFSNIALRSSLVAGRSAPLRRIWCPERVGSNAGAAEWPSYHELPLFLWQKSESANLCQSANYNWSKIYKHTTPHKHKHNRNDTDTNNIHTHTEAQAPARIQAHAHSKHAAQTQKQGSMETRSTYAGKPLTC